MSTIALENMEFHAFHGCFAEEQLTGNTFIVNLHLDIDTSKAEISDNLKDTVNYAEVYDLVKKEMETKSKLLEHIGRRIIKAIEKQFPDIEKIQLKISKMNPPVGGKIENVSLILTNR